MEWKNAVDRRNTGSYKWEALVVGCVEKSEVPL